MRKHCACALAKQWMLLVGILPGLCCVGAWAQTRTNNLPPVADAFVRDGSSANSNFGSATVLQLMTANSGNNRDAYLKFDLTGLWSIQSAQLRVYATLTASSPTSLGTTVYAVANTNWSETGLTWNNKPARGSSLSSVTIQGTTYAWYTVDVGSYIRSQRAAGSNLVSLCLHDPTSNNGQMINLYSKEAASNGPVLVVVSTNAPPTVALTSPTNNTVLAASATVQLNASAGDSDGTVRQVDFYAGTTLLGSATASPFSYTWTNAAAGSYVLRALATDDGGLTATSSVVNLKVDLPPLVSLINPPNNLTLASPATVLLAARASDSDGAISQVSFYAGTNRLASVASAPYSYSWTNVGSGTYVLQAVATDDAGLSAISSAVNLKVDAPPVVSLTSPANNAVFAAPATVTLAASAADGDGSIRRVDFFAGTNWLASVSAPPYVYTWTNVSAGAYALWAVATDDVGNAATAPAINITVGAPPQINLSSPTNQAAFASPATVLLAASAADSDGTISRVDFYVGTNLLASAWAPPYTYTWSGVSNGTYALWAAAFDNVGLAATSSVATITVSPLVVTLTSPTNNAFFVAPATIGLAATTLDNSSPISHVDFYAGTSLLASVSAPPYAFSWQTAAGGTYALWAAATDNAGQRATSSVVSVTVGVPPSVSLTAPTNNAAFVVAQTLSLQASSSGSLAKVEFWDGTNKLGETLASPWTFSWRVTVPGSHTLTAKATDGLGLVATSAPVAIQVTDADSDYDGRSNLQELADGTDPFDPSSVRPVLLGSWGFNTSQFLGDQGQVPLYTNGVALVASWDSNAVGVAYQALGSGLVYRDVETNFQANFNCRSGSARFWFKPNWSSSVNGAAGGPGTDARLLELGGYGQVEGWWALGINPAGTALYLGTMTNLNYTFYFTQPLNWSSNHWYQLVVTYSTNSTVLYINGELCATGPGIQSLPSARLRAEGFRIGIDFSGGQSPDGQFEDLETFNYPLDALTVARGFPNHQSAAEILDSDYDGRSDFLETQVDGTDSNNAANVVPVRLGYWRFDSSDWHGELGQLPLSANGVTAASGWSGNAVQVPGPAGSAGLVYRDVETNGWANLNCRNGTVMFWFKPNWNSGTNGGLGGTGAAARLLEMGDPTSAEGWWALLLNSNASLLSFSTMSNLNTTTCLAAPLNWDSNHWYRLALTYTPTASALYVNGNQVASGTGVQAFPSARLRAAGFRLGAGLQPGQAANGRFDELETFNYAVAPAQITAEVTNVLAIDFNLDGIPDVLQDLPLAQSQPFSTTPFVVAGSIEAEQFDEGGNGVGYLSQTDAATTDYRTTRLAIDPCTDLGGGYCVSRLRAGDWLQYTFQTPAAGSYTVEVRAAADTLGGQLFVVLGKANGVANCQSASQSISQPGWQGLVFPNLKLDAGPNTLRVVMASNASDGYVGRINYISIYPTIPAFVPSPNGLVLNVTQAPYGAIGDGNPANASLNRVAFQNALNALMTNAAGGTLFVPAGTYFLDKDPARSPGEDPSKGGANNCSLFLGRAYGDTRPLGGIEIRGDPAGQSILQAIDRSTTLVYVHRYWNVNPGLLYSNFSFSRLTFKGRPHIRPDGTSDPGAFNNYNANSAWSYGLGALLVFGSDDPASPVSGVNVSQCSFLNSSAYGVVMGNCQDMAFTGNQIRFWDGEPLPVASTNQYDSTNGIPVGQVGIFGSGSPSINVVALSNSFNGNPALGPLSADYSSDGFIWFQAGGNWFAAGNSLTNYGLEAIQYNAGPGAAVGNRFVTTQRTGSTAALVALGTGWSTLSSSFGPVDSDEFFTFTGNAVQGGREAFFGVSAWQQVSDPTYGLYFCGNDITLAPPNATGPDVDWVSQGARLSNCRAAFVAGNLLRVGEVGLWASLVHEQTELLKNDFGAADHMSLLYDCLPDSLQAVSLAKNRLSSGRPFAPVPGVVDPGGGVHLTLPGVASARFFSISNTFVDGSGAPNGLLLNPPNAPVYFWP